MKRTIPIAALFLITTACAAVGQRTPATFEKNRKSVQDADIAYRQTAFGTQVKERYVLKVGDRKKSGPHCVEIQCKFIDYGGQVVPECASADNTYYDEPVPVLEYNQRARPAQTGTGGPAEQQNKGPQTGFGFPALLMAGQNARTTRTPTGELIINPGLSVHDAITNYAMIQARNRSQFVLMSAEFDSAYGLMDPYYEMSLDVVDKAASKTVKACSTMSARGLQLQTIEAKEEEKPADKGGKK